MVVVWSDSQTTGQLIIWYVYFIIITIIIINLNDPKMYFTAHIWIEIYV